MRLFYFITDSYPAWRVDLSELFARELRSLGVQTTWSMRRDDAGFFSKVSYQGDAAYLPFSAGDGPGTAALLRRVGELISEMVLFFRLIFGQRFDVIQVRDDRYTAGFFAWIAARIRGSKFVYWVSFPFPENDLEKSRLVSGWRRRFLRLRGTVAGWWLYRFMLHRADHVFVQSERMRNDIARKGVKLAKMTPVPMGVAPRLFSWAADHHVERESGRVVYLGTLAAPRHLEVLIHAFARVLKRVPHATLFMVGRGDIPEDAVRLKQICVQLGVIERVRFTGLVPLEAAWAYAASAEVCVSPIRPSPVFDCGSPTKLYEYMAIGCRVVANDHPEQKAVFDECPYGECVSWGEQQFSEAICRALESPSQSEEDTMRVVRWAQEHRSYDRLAAIVGAQYAKLIGDSLS